MTHHVRLHRHKCLESKRHHQWGPKCLYLGFLVAQFHYTFAKQIVNQTIRNHESLIHVTFIYITKVGLGSVMDKEMFHLQTYHHIKVERSISPLLLKCDDRGCHIIGAW